MEPLGIISNLRDLWRNSGLESNSPFQQCRVRGKFLTEEIGFRP